MPVSEGSSEKPTTTSSSLWSTMRLVVHALALAALAQVLYLACFEAYDIRLMAIKEYGRVIHEFDPYFNYRATEYLWANGWQKFRTVCKHNVEMRYGSLYM
jgi:dolichyl-diphosphooligosaccharide--protein glycosyltransferase